MNWALYVIAAYLAYGTLSTVSKYSGPPKPPKPGAAVRGSYVAAAVAVNAGIIAVLVIAAGRLA